MYSFCHVAKKASAGLPQKQNYNSDIPKKSKQAIYFCFCFRP